MARDAIFVVAGVAIPASGIGDELAAGRPAEFVALRVEGRGISIAPMSRQARVTASI